MTPFVAADPAAFGVSKALFRGLLDFFVARRVISSHGIYGQCEKYVSWEKIQTAGGLLLQPDGTILPEAKLAVYFRGSCTWGRNADSSVQLNVHV